MKCGFQNCSSKAINFIHRKGQLLSRVAPEKIIFPICGTCFGSRTLLKHSDQKDVLGFEEGLILRQVNRAVNF
jgi:hypothetical protein